MKDYRKIAAKISRDCYNYPGLIGILWIGSTAFGIHDNETDYRYSLIGQQEPETKSDETIH